MKKTKTTRSKKDWRKEHVFKVNLPFHARQKLTVVVSNDAQWSYDKRRKEAYTVSTAVFSPRWKDNLIIFRDDQLKAGTIAHEALHATVNIQNFIGAALVERNDENHAYLLDFIVQFIHDSFKKAKIKL